MEERSEKIRKILNTKPHWILRYGITLIFVLFIVLLVIVFCFDYPYGDGKSIFATLYYSIVSQ